MERHQRAAPPPGASADEFVMSDASVDRMGDVIEQSGWQLQNFAPDRNPIALFNHDKNQVIGRWATKGSWSGSFTSTEISLTSSTRGGRRSSARR